MADIFVGYARQDRLKALPIIRALESQGVSVWWDAELIPGVNFDTEIFGQLEAAEHIIILWSQLGTQSPWLKAEARFAFENDKLVQVVLDSTELPLRFSGVETHDLSNWQGDLRDTSYLRLLDQLPTIANRTSSDRTTEEVAAWAVTQSVNAIRAYEAFLSQHPTGVFADEARRRISQLSSNGSADSIFISYRRGDSKAVARLLFEHLRAKVDKERIFFDVVSIRPGSHFKEYIQERLIKCSTILVIIGPSWAGTKIFGRSKMASKNDFVRLELETAFEFGLRVIPILTDMMHLPKPRSLPKSVRRICDIQAANIDLGTSYDQDIARLTAAATDQIRS